MTALPLIDWASPEQIRGWASPEQVRESAALLRKACDVLDRQGWVQGEYLTEDGRCCAIGAIRVAEYGLDGPLPQTFGFDEITTIACALFRRVNGMDTAKFNDEPGRTVAEVKAKLIETAAYAEKEVAKWENSQTTGASEG